MDPDLLLENIVSTVKTAKAFGVPIVHSTVNVASGRGQPTVPELAELLEDNPPIDRTTLNAWEDADFLAAVRTTGRRKLIACALWTEICMAFPALDALREGYDVYPVVDAIGGTSEEAHRAGLERVVQAGGQPDQLGRARLRAPARLGARGDGGRRRRDRAHRTIATGMSVDAPPGKRAAIADPEAREFLRNAYPILERVIDAHPDFPSACVDRRASRTRCGVEPARRRFSRACYSVAGRCSSAQRVICSSAGSSARPASVSS